MTTVTVHSGDTLWGIARRAGVTVQQLVGANPQVKNPDLIHPGQVLRLPGHDGKDVFEPAPQAPSTAASRTYRVQVGDCMSAIAQRMGVSLPALVAANPQVRNPSLIWAGQLLNVPAGGRDPAPAPAVNPTRPAAPGSNPYHGEFVRAARTAGVPESWANNAALIQLVRHESGFRPSAKNPTSSAFGLFQFLTSTWKGYLKEVPYGSADPYWQAVGGFRYIKARYGTPERAWAFWQATVNRNASLAPADLRSLAQYWISKGYGGY